MQFISNLPIAALAPINYFKHNIISVIYLFLFIKYFSWVSKNNKCDVFVCLTNSISQIGIPARIQHSQVAWQCCLVDQTLHLSLHTGYVQQTWLPALQFVLHQQECTLCQEILRFLICETVENSINMIK